MQLLDIDELDQKAEQKPAEEPPRLQPIQKPWHATAIALVGLFILALFYTFYFAREFFLPLTLAWMLSLLLKPVVRGLKRMHVPEALGAGIVLLGMVGIVVAGVILVKEPASEWAGKAPETFRTAGER